MQLTVPEQLDGYSVAAIGDVAFSQCVNLTNVTLPGGLTYIGKGAFDRCIRLTSIALPESVETINANPFTNCDALIEIRVAPGNPVYATIDGVLFDKRQKKLVAYPVGLSSDSYSVPNGILSIGDCAFSGCKLTNITLPGGTTSIGDWAFGYCQSLTNITLPDSLTSIGDLAFIECGNLTNVTIPASVVRIGSGAFALDISLTVTEGSYAEQYAKDNDIQYQYTPDWLNN